MVNPLGEPPAGEKPAWKSLPSWFVFGSGDRNIPVEGLRFTAERAGSLETREIDGGRPRYALSRSVSSAGRLFASRCPPGIDSAQPFGLEVVALDPHATVQTIDWRAHATCWHRVRTGTVVPADTPEGPFAT